MAHSNSNSPTDTELLNWVELNRCTIEVFGLYVPLADREDDDDDEDGNWNVTPGAMNPAIRGIGSTARLAIIDAIERNGGE